MRIIVEFSEDESQSASFVAHLISSSSGVGTVDVYRDTFAIGDLSERHVAALTAALSRPPPPIQPKADM